jgi:hypothetical protein
MRSTRTRVGVRLALAAALATLAVLAVTAAGAEAKAVKLSGETTVTPTAQVKQFFVNNGVTVAPTGPATASGGSFTFPIIAGFGNAKTFNGILVHSGGLRFTKAGKSVVVRRFVAVRFGHRAFLLAQVPGLKGGCKKLRKAVRHFAFKHPRVRQRVRRLARRYPAAARKVLRAVRNYCSDGRVIVLARLRNLKKEVSGRSATLSANLRLSREAARLVNKTLGTSVPAGVLLGSGVSHVTLVP